MDQLVSRRSLQMESGAILRRFHLHGLAPPDFHARLHDCGYDWFITKIPAGQPGAGYTIAEMRGDMPDNFFTWILRYPGQDAVIITLRNVYGSTEGLVRNLQAILFDAEPHLPSRNVKDVAAQICVVPIRWVASPIARALTALAILAITIRLVSRRKRQA
jgi:hypothetical protein